MLTVEIMIIVFIGLVLLLGIVLGGYFQQGRFINELTQTLDVNSSNKLPLSFKHTPRAFKPLIRNLNQLHKNNPVNLDRDKLTGLSNRVGFKRKMFAKMPATEGMLILVDIQQFRFVNDLFGFVFGDQLLQAFAVRIKGLTTPPAFVSRMNGNEFLLFYPNSLLSQDLQDMKQHFQRPFEIAQTPICIKVQLGVLELNKHHADVSLMLRRLDLALKKAKRSSGSVAFYNQDDDKAQYRELLIINSLPKGLKQNQLYMVYQPKLDMNSGACHQVEALIRWKHAGLGDISPSEFIPLAEHTGIIDLVSHWALDEVLKQQVKWINKGLNIKVAVNLSTKDLENKQLPIIISSKLLQYKVPAQNLTIEITESALMIDLNSTIETLNTLRDIGVSIAIDDFGTGHSSLAYLRHLPVDEVKIDKAFLDDFNCDLQANKIVKTSIDLASSLGFNVTVEGVETKAVFDTLIGFGANTIQGDYFSKPLRPSELEHCLAQLTYPVSAT
ncbi:bifunctional diguanylate cyclase/phosphodiesterase [Shewanella sp. 10N.286.52.B9]|uniref:putative bifunctional diguanylate cyclase/phosphodiesterase n=1 Tax=Shewanella sp. 10N.286.52.B9 TaxID=1880837 RepID=UPI000C8662E3|nr:bifunctional diguanylate cyclase/phosphodiesterase [Shewanella sp. 10N.286.52.B9]PMG40306.1 diguanylate cyclase [Shewanella sp. 10N.286.52.B9]